MRSKQCTYSVVVCRNCGNNNAGNGKKVCDKCGNLRQCKQTVPNPMNNYCRSHGNRGSPAVRIGITSKKPIFNLMAKNKREFTEKVQDAMNDPELTALRRPLALISVRVQQLLERIDVDASEKRWKSALKAWEDYKLVTSPTSGNMRAYRKLDALMADATSDVESWEQIFGALDLQRKLSESETKRLKEMEMLITYEKVMDILMSLMNVIVQEVPDGATLRTIQSEFIRVLGAGYIPTPRTSSDGFIDVRSSDLDAEEFLDTGIEGADRVRTISSSELKGSSE